MEGAGAGQCGQNVQNAYIPDTGIMSQKKKGFSTYEIDEQFRSKLYIIEPMTYFLELMINYKI